MENPRGRTSIATASLVLILAACGGTVDHAADPAAHAGGDPAGGGGSAATITIGDETWGLANVACRMRSDGTEPFMLAASNGLIGVSLSELSLYVNVRDDGGEGLLEGDSVVHQVVLSDGPIRTPTLHRRGASDAGEMTITIAGPRITARGTFDDVLTPEVEEVPGTVEADCGTIIADAPEPSVAPAEADGWVTVGGETFEFTLGDPPLCNLPGGDGRVRASGVLVDDPTRAVTFNYGTADATQTGSPAMQIIVDGPDGNQLWYSAVGILSTDVGSIDSIEVDGNTVRISGRLADGSDTTTLADFTAEMTCDV